MRHNAQALPMIQAELSTVADGLSQAYALLELCQTLSFPLGQAAAANSGLSAASIQSALEMAEETLSASSAKIKALTEATKDVRVKGEIYEAFALLRRGYSIVDILSTLATNKGLLAKEYSGLSNISLMMTYEMADENIKQASERIKALLV